MLQQISISAGESSKKLENFLKKRFPIGYVRKLFRKNGVRLNGKRSKPGDLIAPGDCIQLYIPFEKSPPSGRLFFNPPATIEIYSLSLHDAASLIAAAALDAR